jgi:hypothetical protein
MPLPLTVASTSASRSAYGSAYVVFILKPYRRKQAPAFLYICKVGALLLARMKVEHSLKDRATIYYSLR